ncbi:unnamed protein product [Enterobius vermicularis]|uniref:Amiloride-sensitive sodium channel n=1 Tax=Enterobius vermicularis TaxID=51028 RepID=A0A0N4VN26_ENTVE|nr:unnamed protein product [Enterobius vermicularis]
MANYEWEGENASKSAATAVATMSLSEGQSSRVYFASVDKYESACALLRDFCARTSSHGIPLIGSPAFFNRCVWTFITLFCFIAFLVQTYWTLSDYLQYRTIIEMQLKFEPAPFPAATVCNLNPFKHSEVLKYEDLARGLNIWTNEMDKMDASKRMIHVRKKREPVVYEPIKVQCRCVYGNSHCVPKRDPFSQNDTMCICFKDKSSSNIWPCYPEVVWEEEKCYSCSTTNTCIHPKRFPKPEDLLPEEPTRCLCQSVTHNCVVFTGDIPMWTPYKYSAYVTSPDADNEELKAYGMKDKNDLTSKTVGVKEAIINLVAAMPREHRQNLSYTLHEFVLRCSFNNFKLHMDPVYGNCYTFNFNDSVELKNSRAGPMYGLRLLLNVNQSDYMPTTEAAGVRLVVHEQDQEPFPDTFGYSAPTGFISSFGLKTKVLHRLRAPYGKCEDDFRPEGYIYEEHYSPEGCYRSCFQHAVINTCQCGDPRFPLPPGFSHYCDIKNNTEMACMSNFTGLRGFHHIQHECNCVQPCNENVFETAYSCSAFPALMFNLGSKCPGVPEISNNSQDCTEYYRVNTAYIEIYYEQLNFETLKETPGYTLVNLFSDFGGNIGLWIGFSIITSLC